MVYCLLHRYSSWNYPLDENCMTRKIEYINYKNMIENTIKKIEQWVVDRNLHTQDPKVQMCKTVEELGELARAINKGDREKQIDSIGDTVVTLICMSKQLGIDFTECVEYAYNEIKDRKGKLINGIFVKEADFVQKKIKHINDENRNLNN